MRFPLDLSYRIFIGHFFVYFLAGRNYRSLSFVPSAVFQSVFPLDVCPRITADAADGALNS
jgi:hypothetical protein